MNHTTKTFLVASLIWFAQLATDAAPLKVAAESRIDRHALVTRHNISWDKLAGRLPLGNGEFCFGADATGLQTFAETFAGIACLSPERRLGVVGRRRGFFLSGAVPQKIPLKLSPKSIGSSSRN
jgi:hypothetical protein